MVHGLYIPLSICVWNVQTEVVGGTSWGSTSFNYIHILKIAASNIVYKQEDNNVLRGWPQYSIAYM